MTPDLESILISDMQAGKPVELERALLIVSGADTEEQVSEYRRKLDNIMADFNSYLSVQAEPKIKSTIIMAMMLHYFLFKTRPHRYGDEFLLTDVIDAQLDGDPDKPVGDCMGLTALYTVLGLRLGLNVSVLSLPEHVLCVLHDKGREHLIETTSSQGFNMNKEAYKISPGVGITNHKEEEPVYLVAYLLIKRGLSKCDLEDYRAAKADYDKAITLDPDNSDAYCNRGNSRHELGDYAGAMADYDQAIMLDPYDAEIYYNRGNTRYAHGDYINAIYDFDMAISLKPDFIYAYNNRGVAKEGMRDYAGAMADFTMSLKINPDNETGMNNLRLCKSPVFRLFHNLFSKRQKQ
jgi:tetratricopeptide (TPR) repeat protein